MAFRLGEFQARTGIVLVGAWKIHESNDTVNSIFRLEIFFWDKLALMASCSPQVARQQTHPDDRPRAPVDEGAAGQKPSRGANLRYHPRISFYWNKIELARMLTFGPGESFQQWVCPTPNCLSNLITESDVLRVTLKTSNPKDDSPFFIWAHSVRRVAEDSNDSFRSSLITTTAFERQEKDRYLMIKCPKYDYSIWSLKDGATVGIWCQFYSFSMFGKKLNVW